MIIQHNKTEKKYTINADTWSALQKSGKAGSYKVIQSDVKKPKEIKMSGKQKPEYDKVNERTFNAVPGGDAGENF